MTTSVSMPRIDFGLSVDVFRANLIAAEQRRIRRLSQLTDLLKKNPLCLFGFGGKGRTLAHYIANSVATDLVIFDSNHAIRDRARAEGFTVIHDFGHLDTNSTLTILGACQAQAEQAAVVRHNFIYYQEAAYLYDTPFLFDTSRAFTDNILTHVDDFFEIYQRIHPNARKAFFDVLSFRVSLDPSDVAGSRHPNCDMWFDQFEKYSTRRHRSFLDIGAYNGDTLQIARDRLRVSRGIAVEANSGLLPAIKTVAAGYTEGIRILPAAAWSHDCTLTFEEVRGGMIRVFEDLHGTLPAVAIDSVVTEGVDLLKMDIEGSELRALSGARQLLSNSKPDLTLAAYHRPLDLLDFFSFLDAEGLAENYARFHIAHYSDCFDDTILYCLRDGN